MRYDSEQIFDLPPDRLVADANNAGMTWVLLIYLQQRYTDDPSEKSGTRLLATVYQRLGCSINAAFLYQQARDDSEAEGAVDADVVLGLGLRLGVSIKIGSLWSLPSSDAGVWEERDLILEEAKQHPEEVYCWLSLAAHYLGMEETLMALWTLFVIKMNAPESRSVAEVLIQELDTLKFYATCQHPWAFAAGERCREAAANILSMTAPVTDIADAIRHFCNSWCGVSISTERLLGEFVWPRGVKRGKP